MTTLSLDLAQELQSVCKEKNIEMPESWWLFCDMGDEVKTISSEAIEDTSLEGRVIAPAFLLDELLEWLPSKMKDKYGTYMLQVTKIDEGYDVGYNKDYADCPAFATYWDLTNPCDACGKLLIWLIKENLL